ncbi:MAG TPA: nucleoside deaminase [Burkholderiales bacterium]|nr:nucleoside deaminase [Burkholderiales bacterium]
MEPLVVDGVPTEADAAYLRRVIAMALHSRAAGRHPFGSLVVLEGRVIAEAQSLKSRDTDATSHSEMRVLREASSANPPPVLARATLYASTEPCAMCAGAAYWAGIGRIVYGFSEERLRALTGAHPWNPTLALPCRELFARGRRRIEVVGPYLEEEAAAPHHGFWEAWRP